MWMTLKSITWSLEDCTWCFCVWMCVFWSFNWWAISMLICWCSKIFDHVCEYLFVGVFIHCFGLIVTLYVLGVMFFYGCMCWFEFNHMGTCFFPSGASWCAFDLSVAVIVSSSYVLHSSYYVSWSGFMHVWIWIVSRWSGCFEHVSLVSFCYSWWCA